MTRELKTVAKSKYNYVIKMEEKQKIDKVGVNKYK